MATRVYGIDLGSYSVKVVVALPGLRGATVVDAIERPVPPGDEPAERRATRVLGEIVRTLGLKDDIPYAAVPGDQIFIHVLDFAFRNLRRQELQKAVGAELEGILPVELEDMVFSFDDLPRSLVAGDGGAGSGGDPSAARGGGAAEFEGVQTGARPPRARVAAPAAGMRVLACAMRIQRARDVLDLCRSEEAEPRGLLAAPLSYVRLTERVGAAQASRAGGPPVAVIDVGHGRTNVCVLMEGRAVYGRKIARGGRDLTDLIARKWGLSREDAEKAKHEDGFVASAAEPAPSDAWQSVHDVLIKEVEPLARDIRNTLTACAAKTGATAASAVLVGGGSRLRGLDLFLGEKLHIPVSTLSAVDQGEVLGARLAQLGVSADTMALASAVALEGSAGRPNFDLRQGELAPRTDLSFLRSKVPQLAAFALAVLALSLTNAYASYYKQSEEEEVLADRLGYVSKSLAGEAMDADEAMRWFAEDAAPAESPLPELSAYDELLLVNDAIPERDETPVEIRDLVIRPGEIRLDAAAEGTEELGGLEVISRVESELDEQDCFDDISRGDTSTAPDGSEEFSLRIETSCR